MDFWASTEHKLSYKYEKNLPPGLRAELDDAARVADELDQRMERLRGEIRPQAAPGGGSGLFPERPGASGATGDAPGAPDAPS